MNTYTYRLTPESIAVLEGLLGINASAVATSESVTMMGADRSVVVRAEADDFEPNFECYRLWAEPTNVHPLADRIQLGRIESIHVLTAEEWIIDARGEQVKGMIGRIQAYQESGPPGSAPPEALAVCQADEGILVTGSLRSLLVHCDPMAYVITWSTDEEQIGACLAERLAVRLARTD